MFKEFLLMALLAASEVDAKAKYSPSSSSYTKRYSSYTPSSYSYSGYGGGSSTYVNIGGGYSGYNYGYYNHTTVHTNGGSAVGFFLFVALIICCVVLARCRGRRDDFESYEQPMPQVVVEETVVINHGTQPGAPYMPPMPGMQTGFPQGPPPAYPPGHMPMQPGMYPPG